MGEILIWILLLAPFLLSLWNIYVFVQCLRNKEERAYNIAIEIVAIGLGLVDLYLYCILENIQYVDWYVQLQGADIHSFISLSTFPTIIAISVIAYAASVLIRLIPANRQPPLVSALGIAAVYLGIAVCLLFGIQTAPGLHLILPINCILILIKSIFLLVFRERALWEQEEPPEKFQRLSAFFRKATNLPLIALLLVLPLLGIIIAVLALFGQEPNSIIKAWTDTADWNLSQQIPPKNLPYDGHYLCTVAAGGHRKIVKPLRTGLRHGHRVVVNRQLCIANAFEQVLSEKTPRFHKRVRSFYDRAGYPIAKHIRTKWVADVVYFIMKPLEWFFLLVLYTVDAKPEDRIAVQYPHAALPTTEP